MEADPVSETLCLKKLKTMKDGQSSYHNYLLTTFEKQEIAVYGRHYSRFYSESYPLAFSCRPFNEILEIEFGLFSTASSP
jgi:hypothetical protein